MRWLFSAIVLAGCASARVEGGGNNDIDANQNNGGDANNNQDANADAPPIDAPPPPPDAPPPPPPMAVTMQQTGATNVVATQIGCQQTNPATGFTRENSYYRIYPLSDFNITKPFSISKVNFSVERATAGNGVSQPAQIKLGTYSGTLNASTFALASLQQLASATIQIPQNATSVEVPIASFTPNTLTVQPSALLYVEIFIPDGAAAGNTFYLGSNGGSETHPSYIRAPLCNVASPATYATILTSPLIRTLITVSGSF
jgi:hypothetical protein